ncbi:kynurenine--oxoglutarate transaminase 3-like isoform X1 [Rhopilema esculentum]|uniref:kynurenine--oxoglutarate transaminase 3-like isoform X1 n=1 Tax=Rhopilema esculentum TaxID=499914 RepID=UPI0031D697F8
MLLLLQCCCCCLKARFGHMLVVLAMLPTKFLEKRVLNYLKPRLIAPLASSAPSRSMSQNTASAPVIKPAKRLDVLEPSVWIEFTGLVRKHKPVNLGQGLPDFATPKILSDALYTTQGDNTVHLNQYTRSQGHPRLVNAIANLYGPMFNRQLNPLTEVITTVGGYEALYCLFTSMIDEGDEVIMIEPFFDCYLPMTRLAGGVPVCVPLRAKPGAKSSADLYLDKEELENAFSDKTKAIVVNTPHNPTGKVFSRDELEFLASLCKKHNVLYISDEVYEWIVYDGKEHIRMATLPGMWDRTVTVCSAGKTFSITGWKIGWAIGPEDLISNCSAIHAQSIYTMATPLQEALAQAIEHEIKLLGTKDSYWKWMADTLFAKRNQLVDMVKAAGMVPIIPEGGYFMMADVSPLKKEFEDDGSGDTYDVRFAKWLLKEKGLATIPVGPFYSKEHRDLARNYTRFCFIKEDDTMQKAEEILKNLSI